MELLKDILKDYKSPNNDEIYEQEMLNFDEQFRNYFKTHSFTYKELKHLFTDDGMKELLYNLWGDTMLTLVAECINDRNITSGYCLYDGKRIYEVTFNDLYEQFIQGNIPMIRGINL